MDLQLDKYFKNWKGFFKKEKTHSIGVDVGGNNFKIVELKKEKGQIVLKNYALVKVNEGVSDNNDMISEHLGVALRKVFDELKIKSDKINVALPTTSSLITLIEVENKEGGYLKQAIELEAPKYIPVDLKDIVYDWQVIENPRKEASREANNNKNDSKEEEVGNSTSSQELESETKKVLLVSVMKEVSKKFQKIFSKNNFEIDYLEVDCFPIKKSLIRNGRGNYIILDIGGKASNIIGIYNGNIIFNRNLDIAGNRLTDLIADTLGVGRKKAENIKIEKGFSDDSFKVAENVVKPFFDNLVKQVKKTQEEFHDFFKDEGAEAIVLTGGTSQMKGLRDYLEKSLETKIYYGNPWAGINFPNNLKEKLYSLSPYFAIATGLALMGLEEEQGEDLE
ncbi:MAG: pilus assembly protein PilM [Patescibacteria group bacterium]